jgi:hypothetical protein
MTLTPPPATRLSGDEPFAGLDANVLDFWRFAMSDLRTNNVRGYLAEFLVARAVGTTTARTEWDAYDVRAPDGTRIEVKASGYLQAWTQAKVSSPSFRVRPTRGWDSSSDSIAPELGLQADVYVLCLHTAKQHAHYDPLDIAQWEFFVASREIVEETGIINMGLTTVRRMCGAPVVWEDLAEAIRLIAASRGVG